LYILTDLLDPRPHVALADDLPLDRSEQISPDDAILTATLFRVRPLYLISYSLQQEAQADRAGASIFGVALNYPSLFELFGRALRMIAVRIRSDKLRACSFSIMWA
jgi:hypothetical protein